MQKVPGSGVLPAEWLDGASIANALKAISRQHSNLLLNYGAPQGFLPLRQQLHAPATPSLSTTRPGS